MSTIYPLLGLARKYETNSVPVRHCAGSNAAVESVDAPAYRVTPPPKHITVDGPSTLLRFANSEFWGCKQELQLKGLTCLSLSCAV